MFNDSHVMANTKNKKLGIKIVNNPYNKRESDPFNTKNTIQGKSSSISYQEKMILVEKSQNFIQSQLRVNFSKLNSIFKFYKLILINCY